VERRGERGERRDERGEERGKRKDDRGVGRGNMREETADIRGLLARPSSAPAERIQRNMRCTLWVRRLKEIYVVPTKIERHLHFLYT
jgi:hypothetical protein